MKSGIFLFNNRQELISSISPEFLTENTQEMELNGLITATATTKYDKDIEEAEYFGVKELNNFWLYKIRTFQKKDGMITLKGIHILFDDLKGKVLRDIRPKNVTAKEGFNKILENSTWQVGVSTATTNSSASFYYKPTLTAFYEALKKWNCEFIPHIEFRNGKIISKTINLYDTISKDNGKWFEYGDKLLTVVAEMTKDIYTGFIGLGKGEQTENGGFGRKIKFDTVEWEKSKGNPIDKPLLQDYIEIKEATKRWGYPNGTPRIGIVEFSEVTDREELLNKTYLYAKENCRPKLQLKATTISDEMVEIGETCSIIRPDLKIRYRTRVFKIKKNFLNTDLIEFEFGDKVILSASDRVKADIEKEEKRQLELESRMESFLKTATNFYFNEDGYNYELKANNKYKLPAGYYSFDKPIEENPTKVVYMGAGKILIADSKNPSGEWNWRTAITPQGIAGEEIVANSITANKLSADVGQSLDLSSNESITQAVSNRIENVVGNISSNLAKLNIKQNEIETLISETTAIIENLIKNKTVTVNKNNSFKEVINLEKGKAYNFKFSSKGNCEVYVVFTYKDDKRRYKYKYPKKFIDKRLIGGKYSSTFYSNHILSFKVPEQYKESYIIYKGIEDSEIKDISLGEHIGQYNADRITRLKQDLDGFKLTAENNINKVKSEFNVKADEISSKVKNVENKISTEIAQSTNEIKSTVKEMKEDLKQFKNLCKESNKEIKGNDIYFDCEKLLKGQKYKVTFKAKDIENNADYKVYNSDMNYRKISENNAWVFTPSQDMTQLNLYNGGGSNPKANIYDVKIFKLNDDPRLEELKSEIKQTSTEISLKVSKKDIVSEINQSAESVKIRANKIELDGDVIANKLTSKRLYGNYIDGAVINGGTIKIGNYGFLQPAQNCLQIKVPQTQYATYGIGVQIHGRKATKNIPAGMFIYRDDDFERGNDIGDNVEEILLTVAGRMQACFKFNGQEISGTPVMTNFYKNNPVGGDMYAIRFIGYDPHTRCIYFDDGTGSSGAWRLSTDSSSSDIRLKFNIKESNQDCLDLISKINFKSFDWKKDKFGYAKEHTKTGIIADELQELDDSLVYTHTNDDKKTKYIDDFRLLAVTTKAVQELNKKVEELQLKIKQLEER